jgi:NADPH2:quinone reductase
VTLVRQGLQVVRDIESDLQMYAVTLPGGRGAASDLVLGPVPKPHPRPGEILVRVRAAGVNRPDLMQRMGLYPPPPGAPEILGLEVAGEVDAVGEGVSRWRPGDEVAALLGGGGYAQFAVADARHALPIPRGLDLEQAAALPETVFTVFANVFEAGRLRAGETLLVHGATSGIGTTAIQMAKAAGARVITTSRGADKTARALTLGADVAVDSQAGDWLEPVQAAGGADVVLDMVGGDYFSRNLKVLRPEGRLVHIAAQAGSKVDLELWSLMSRRLSITGSTLRPRSADEKARLAAEVERVVWPWIEQGLLKPVIEARFPLDQAGAAHQRLEAGDHIGKVMLIP